MGSPVMTCSKMPGASLVGGEVPFAVRFLAETGDKVVDNLII